MERMFAWVQDSPDQMARVLISLVIFLVLWLLRRVSCSIARKKISDLARFHHWRRIINYVFWVLVIILIGSEWVAGFESMATFFGFIGAGLILVLKDGIANIAGWLFIVVRKPFEVGNRIEVEGMRGDVIDIRLFQFSMIEIANWVDADQSTGRIIHVPNSKALSHPICNYETGFEYVWHEIPVLITFESDWDKAKRILSGIAHEKAQSLSKGAEEQIRRAAMKYFIYFDRLTPIVYTTVKESGVMLTIRYIVKPRRRRNSEQDIWEAILTAFATEDDVFLAYPTTRYYVPGDSPSAHHPPIEKTPNK
jgi:small-conductance mechanosensitive channel